MSRVVFEEVQAFTQWWLIAIILGVFAFTLHLSIDLLELEDPGTKEIAAYLFVLIPLLLVIFLFAFSRLYTRIDENGILAVFRPFSFTKRSYSWDEVEKVEVTEYNPLREFGGWGYRISLKDKKTAMNVKGKNGILLHLGKKKQFLIGTQRPLEAKKAIEAYMNSFSEPNS